MMFCRITFAATVAGLLLCAPVFADNVTVSSLEELQHYAHKSGNIVTMQPGTYRISDWLSEEKLRDKRAQADYPYLKFTGHDNVFQMDGVKIEADTKLRTILRPPVHTNEFVISGRGNTISGLTLTNIGDATSPGGALLSISGDNNIVQNGTFTVRGSSPYGYGDLFGKGGDYTIGHHKQSGVHIVGSGTQIIGCKLYVHSYGHGFYIQGGHTQSFQDCYVEGKIRATDDMLKETSGPAADIDFRTVVANRDGERRVTPGYMKSLAEDGYRTYHDIRDLTFLNCTAKHMRGGFELRTEGGGVQIQGCQAIECERGYWVGNGATVLESSGDAKYGPLLFVEGKRANVHVQLSPDSSKYHVHAIAVICGEEHQVHISPADLLESREVATPILLGYGAPAAGEGMAEIKPRRATRVVLNNETKMPVEISHEAIRCQVTSEGEIKRNDGKDTQITRE
ncbi:hypothetical protein [Bremerella cremea]|uniref:hypothetical protein n=1 Tax=Bremerella cremea TaxID=1031537 RepID=UPI0031EE2745